MTAIDYAQKVLEKLVGTLGFDAEVRQSTYQDGPLLEIESPDSSYLIGKSGDRLDDLQYLVNRILQKKLPDAERIRVDCNNYRADHEARLIERALEVARTVATTGKPREMRALNAYHRRIVHHALRDQPVKTESQAGTKRYKKIFVLPPS